MKLEDIQATLSGLQTITQLNQGTQYLYAFPSLHSIKPTASRPAPWLGSARGRNIFSKQRQP